MASPLYTCHVLTMIQSLLFFLTVQTILLRFPIESKVKGMEQAPTGRIMTNDLFIILCILPENKFPLYAQRHNFIWRMAGVY